MWRTKLAAFAVVVWVSETPVSAQQTRKLELGSQVSISASGVSKYSVGASGVIDVRIPKDGRDFIVVAERVGRATLLLMYEDGRQETVEFEVTDSQQGIAARENIRLDFYFVELNARGNYQAGVVWPSWVGASDGIVGVDLTSRSVTDATATITGMPLPRLDLLQREGWAKVARHASVITANGNNVLFDSGGELNFAVQGSLAAEIRQIVFGTRLEILPRYDRDSRRLELRVNATISSLGSGGDLPARSRTFIDTVVNVEMNQAVVLAGLESKSGNRLQSGFPVLSQVPVLGGLFRTTGGGDERTQSVLFIVPTVVNLVGRGARGKIQSAMTAYRDFAGGFPNGAVGPGVTR